MPDQPRPHPKPSRTDDSLLGQRFLQILNSLVSTAKIHLDNNQLLQKNVDNFAGIIEECLQLDDEINLLASVGCFYLQQEKVGLQRNAAGLARKMLTYFSKRQIEGLRFKQSTAYASRAEILAFIRLLNQAENEKDASCWLQSVLEEKNFHWVELIDTSQAQPLSAIFAFDQGDTEPSAPAAPPKKRTGENKPIAEQTPPATAQPTREANPAQPGKFEKQQRNKHNRRHRRRTKKAILTYSSAMHSLQDVAQRLASNKNAGLGKSVQLVQNMVDLIMNDDNVLLDLSTIRDYDDYTFTHSINVSILALCLGHRIGLSKVMLSRLGLSALFHDLGKIDVPKEILNKPGKLTTEEFGIIQQHSIYSVRRILRLRASYDRKASIMLAPFEHHLRYDLSGYPQTPRKKPVSLFGRIITIADVYDAVTAPRVYRESYMSPDRALGLMLKDSGTMFDPILLKVFISMLGIYPVGTILVFDDNKIGIVAHAPDETVAPEALWVLLLKKTETNGYTKGKYENLGMWNPETEMFNRKVHQTLHPADLGIQPAEFIL